MLIGRMSVRNERASMADRKSIAAYQVGRNSHNRKTIKTSRPNLLPSG